MRYYVRVLVQVLSINYKLQLYKETTDPAKLYAVKNVFFSLAAPTKTKTNGSTNRTYYVNMASIAFVVSETTQN